jgi:hypothetical protein
MKKPTDTQRREAEWWVAQSPFTHRWKNFLTGGWYNTKAAAVKKALVALAERRAAMKSERTAARRKG